MYPILFKFGPFTIYAYGFMLSVGFLSGIYLAIREAKKEGIEETKIINLGLLIALSSIIGARLLYCMMFSPWEYLRHPLSIFAFWEGGLAFHGGFGLASLTSLWYIKRHKLPLYKLADIISLSASLGYGFGRIGCFLNGCCYGEPTTLPWGIKFPEGSPAFFEFGTLPLHPTQLYMSIFSFFLFFVLYIAKRKKDFPGQIFLLYLVFSSFFRFFIDFLRGDELKFLLGATYSQWISFLLSFVGIVILIKKLSSEYKCRSSR